MTAPRFLADENIAAPLVAAIRDSDWDILSVAEQWPGISDQTVIQSAAGQNRILLTEDKDFGELVFRMQWQNAGVLLLRLPPAGWQEHWVRVHTVLNQYHHRLQGTFTVVEQNRVRFRAMVSHHDNSGTNNP